MKLVGANPKARSEGLDRLPGISNYFIGNDPAKWRTSIPHYAKVCIAKFIRGSTSSTTEPSAVGIRFCGETRRKPSRDQLAFQGAESLESDENGDLLIDTASGK